MSTLFKLLAAAIALAMFAGSADATLKKYFVQRVTISNGPNTSPNPDFIPKVVDPPGDPAELPDPLERARGSVALIDVDPEPNPVLKKLILATDRGTTVDVPGLAGEIFLSNNTRAGPIGEFTGTGTTSAGGTVAWGVVTGWTITGWFWCNSVPDFICSLAMGMDDTTNEPRFNSDFYDLGTWFFHATGFTSIPYVVSYFPTSFGNNHQQLLGPEFSAPGTPALPLLGIGLLGGSLILGGAVALRRKK